MISMFAEPANTTVTSVYVELNIQQITFFLMTFIMLVKPKRVPKLKLLVITAQKMPDTVIKYLIFTFNANKRLCNLCCCNIC